MKTLKKIVVLMTGFFLIMACKQEIPLVSLGIDDYYYIYRMQKLELSSAFTGEAYRWTIKTENGEDSLVSTEQRYIFLTSEEKTFEFTFELIDPVAPYKHKFQVTTFHEEVEYSPYLSKVYEFRPAPGQFVNELPAYEKGDTEKEMCKKVEECISGKNEVLVSLGGYGGYVTFGFDHTVINVKGKKDFAIYGNAFYSDVSDYDNAKGGSSEPGIVMVSYDWNMNGKPDDDWYELAGSEYHKMTTTKGYKITYHRPDTLKKPVTDASGTLTDVEYIPWKDNRGATGYVSKNMYHKQYYYPKWITSDEMTFEGTRLPDNAIDESGFGAYWVLYSFDWGYVDNKPNSDENANSFDIDWAVDKNGNPVHLPGVDFIRVYTGVNQYCGWLGETSTEISKARDLHIPLSSSVIPDPFP